MILGEESLTEKEVREKRLPYAETADRPKEGLPFAAECSQFCAEA